jgi:RNA polymerase sigma-70 factor (ECF subfamily)
LVESIPEKFGGSSETKNHDVKKAVNQALEKLPDLQKQLVLLKDYEGYSYEEIGNITKLSENQVKVYLFRARLQLKTSLIGLENHI